VLDVEAIGYLFCAKDDEGLIQGIPLLDHEVGHLVDGHFIDDSF
jgi:hypothetical protein